jgi:hypothetical protein
VQYVCVVIFDAASFLPRAEKRQLNSVCLQKEMKIVCVLVGKPLLMVMYIHVHLYTSACKNNKALSGV